MLPFLGKGGEEVESAFGTRFQQSKRGGLQARRQLRKERSRAENEEPSRLRSPLLPDSTEDLGVAREPMPGEIEAVSVREVEEDRVPVGGIVRVEQINDEVAGAGVLPDPKAVRLDPLDSLGVLRKLDGGPKDGKGAEKDGGTAESSRPPTVDISPSAELQGAVRRKERERKNQRKLVVVVPSVAIEKDDFREDNSDEQT
jgi:hypothetical protein